MTGKTMTKELSDVTQKLNKRHIPITAVNIFIEAAVGSKRALLLEYIELENQKDKIYFNIN